MKRIIVDYKKLTSEILNLLVEKFPDGYGIRDIIRFTNHKGQYVEAVEVATEDYYLLGLKLVMSWWIVWKIFMKKRKMTFWKEI